MQPELAKAFKDRVNNQLLPLHGDWVASKNNFFQKLSPEILASFKKKS